jgi:hypothetical protein
LTYLYNNKDEIVMREVLLEKYKPYKKKRDGFFRKFLWLVVIIFIFGIAAGFLLKSFFIGISKYGESKYVFYLKSFYDIGIGDRVIVRVGGYRIVRTVVGKAGDYIEVKGGKLFVNGHLVANVKKQDFLLPFFRYKVRRGELFVLGGGDEIDSRFFGAILDSYVIGKVFWSISF